MRKCPKCGAKMMKKIPSIGRYLRVSYSGGQPITSGSNISGVDSNKNAFERYYECTNEDCGYTIFE